MKNYINTNLKYLRKSADMTQNDLALALNVTRAVIGSYEEDRAEPKLSTIQQLSSYFKVSIDALINGPISESVHNESPSGQSLRILTLPVDELGKELVSIVPVKAAAGYADRYGDPEFMEKLDAFRLPLQELYPDQTYRLFQIEGESMLPVQSGSYILTTYEENWNTLKEGETYIVVTESRGIVYKRAWYCKGKPKLFLSSDNAMYGSFELDINEIKEIWHAIGNISLDLKKPENGRHKRENITKELDALMEPLSMTA